MFLIAQFFSVLSSALLPRSAFTLFLCLTPVLILLVSQDNVGTDYQTYYSFFHSDYFGPFERRHEWLSVLIFKFSKLTNLFQVSLLIFYTISLAGLSYSVSKSYDRKNDRFVVLFLSVFAANFLVNQLNLIRYLAAISLWLALFFFLHGKKERIKPTDWILFLFPALLHASTFFLTIFLVAYLRFDIIKRRWMYLGISVAATSVAFFIFNLFDFYEPIRKLNFDKISLIPISKIYLLPLFFLNFGVFYFSKQLDKRAEIVKLLGFSSLLMPLALIYWDQIGGRLFYFLALAQCFCVPLSLSKLRFSQDSFILLGVGYFSCLLLFTFYKFVFARVGEYNYQSILF
jgi:hypothetical protein